MIIIKQNYTLHHEKTRCTGDNMKFAQKTAHLSSAIFAQLKTKKIERLASGKEVMDFSIGTPDLPPPRHVIDVIRQEIENPDNYKYAIKDLPELTEAVIGWYQKRFGVSLEPEEITSLFGSQEGLGHIALTLVDPGDVALIPDPGYPIFHVGPMIAGARLYKMPLLRENHYLIDLDRIESTVAHQARLMIVSYPNNPVTATAPPEFYEKLIWFAKKYDIAIIHDNAYCELIFDGPPGGSILNIPGAKDIAVEFNSLSKSYNLTGCRLAFAVGNREMIGHLKNLKSHLDYGIFLPLQKAAIAAISGPQDCIRETVQIYRRRRDILIDGLVSLGWKVDKPPATMFAWAPLPDGYQSSMHFALELMDRTGVLVVPGSSFGDLGEGFVRFALVQPEEEIKKALAAIKASGMISRTQVTNT